MTNPIWTADRIKYVKEGLDSGISRAEFTKMFSSRYGVALTKGMISGVISRNFQGQSFRMKKKKPQQVGRRYVPPPPPPLVPIPPGPIGPICDFPDGNGCRYIHGDPGAAWQCCGAETVNAPYCPYHVKITRTWAA